MTDKSNAVRGVENLRPGLHVTHWPNGRDDYWFLTDPTPVDYDLVWGDTIQYVNAYALDGRDKALYLGDIGVRPRNEGQTQTCDLGHEHSAEPVYADYVWTERLDTLPTV